MRYRYGTDYNFLKIMRRLLLSILFVGTSFAVELAFGPHAAALPFNDDMVNNQIKTGQIMRPKPEGVVARGVLAGDFTMRLDKKESAANFVNPKKGDKNSIAKGKRLFQINCTPCHGNIEKTPYEAGVAGKLIGAPDLTAQMYKDRTDGSIYGTIHFGGMALMPGYGWKLSPDEHWDVISYLRSAQGTR